MKWRNEAGDGKERKKKKQRRRVKQGSGRRGRRGAEGAERKEGRMMLTKILHRVPKRNLDRWENDPAN